MELFLSTFLMDCWLHFILITWFWSQVMLDQTKQIIWALIISRNNSCTTQAKANSKEQLAHSISIHSFPGDISNEFQLRETNSSKLSWFFTNPYTTVTHFILAVVITLLSIMMHSILKTAGLWVIVKSNLSKMGAWILVSVSSVMI